MGREEGGARDGSATPTLSKIFVRWYLTVSSLIEKLLGDFLVLSSRHDLRKQFTSWRGVRPNFSR